ncbi:Protein CLEC16A [Porphyridium purpureum]|uniref:Protein CLEC16A n=1 Tax=Porphyridium purpureum TaxID=35688 RepID=A0A5J4YKI2_PORPP|nr:Protein CLEC16A [Porphyridium purpureum]|eukprot:POR5266..scf244_11
MSSSGQENMVPSAPVSGRPGLLERWVRSRTKLMDFFSLSAPSATGAAGGAADATAASSAKSGSAARRKEHALIRSRSKSHAEVVGRSASAPPSHLGSARNLFAAEAHDEPEDDGAQNGVSTVSYQDLVSPKHRTTERENGNREDTSSLQKRAKEAAAPNGSTSGSQVMDGHNHDRSVLEQVGATQTGTAASLAVNPQIENGLVAREFVSVPGKVHPGTADRVKGDEQRTGGYEDSVGDETARASESKAAEALQPLFTANEAVYLVQTMSKYTELAQRHPNLVPRTLAATEQRSRARREALNRSGGTGVLTSEDEVLFQAELAAIHALREFADLVVWADRHRAEELWAALELVEVMPTMAHCLVVGSRDVIVQVYQALAISIQSVTETSSLARLFHSYDVTTTAIMCEFEVSDEDILYLYLSCMKTIAQRLDVGTMELLRFFFNQETKEMPIYSYSLRFYDHEDGIVRTAVRNITLCIFRLPVPELHDLIVTQSEDKRHYFRRFARYVSSMASTTRKLYARYRLHVLGQDRASSESGVRAQVPTVAKTPATTAMSARANSSNPLPEDGKASGSGATVQGVHGGDSGSTSATDAAHAKEARRLRNLFYDHVSEISNLFEYANEIMRVSREKLAPCLGAILVDDFFRSIIGVVARKGPQCQGSPSTQAQVASAALIFSIALQRITDQLLSQVLALETLAPQGQQRSKMTFCQGLKVFTAICEDETSLLIALNCFVFLLRDRIVTLEDLYSQGLMMTSSSRGDLVFDVTNLKARSAEDGDGTEPSVSFEQLAGEGGQGEGLSRGRGHAALPTPGEHYKRDVHDYDESVGGCTVDSRAASRCSSRAHLNASMSVSNLYDFDPHDLLWMSSPHNSSSQLLKTASLNARLVQLPNLKLGRSLGAGESETPTPQRKQMLSTASPSGQEGATWISSTQSAAATTSGAADAEHLEDAPLEEVLYTLFFYSHKLKSIRVFANAAFLLFALASKGPLEIDFVNVAASIMNDISKRISTDLFDRDDVTDAMIHHVHDVFYRAAFLQADLSGFSVLLELSNMGLLDEDMDPDVRNPKSGESAQDVKRSEKADAGDAAVFDFNPYDAYAIVILMHLIDKLTAKADLMLAASPVRPQFGRAGARDGQRICSVSHLRDVFQVGVSVSVQQKEKNLLNVFALANTYQYGRFDD